MPGIDYQAIRFWLDVAMLTWAFSVSGFVIWDRRNKVTQDSIQELHKGTADIVQTLRHEIAKELADLRMNIDGRRKAVDIMLDTVRSRQADSPTRADMGDLYRAINQVSTVSSELHGTVTALQNTMQMINQHLLDK